MTKRPSSNRRGNRDKLDRARLARARRKAADDAKKRKAQEQPAEEEQPQPKRKRRASSRKGKTGQGSGDRETKGRPKRPSVKDHREAQAPNEGALRAIYAHELTHKQWRVVWEKVYGNHLNNVEIADAVGLTGDSKTKRAKVSNFLSIPKVKEAQRMMEADMSSSLIATKEHLLRNYLDVINELKEAKSYTQLSRYMSDAIRLLGFIGEPSTIPRHPNQVMTAVHLRPGSHPPQGEPDDGVDAAFSDMAKVFKQVDALDKHGRDS